MSIAAIIRGFTGGYASGNTMKERKEDREQQQKDREQAAQDRELARQERQDKKDYARKVAANMGTIGKAKEVDAGAGFKFTGPDAQARASEFIADNNDPEFGIAAQGVNTQPLKDKPQANGIYTRKDEAEERMRLAGEMGDLDAVKAARAELGSMYSEGVGQALMAFRNGGPQEAIKVYNEYGMDRLTDKFEQTKNGFKLFREDGTSFEVNPEELERNQMDLLKRAQLDKYQAQAKAAGFKTVSDGQDLVDLSTNKTVVSNPKTFNPRVGSGGSGGRVGDGLPQRRFDLATLKETRIQLQAEEKLANDFMAPLEVRDAARARANQLRNALNEMNQTTISGLQTGGSEQAPAANTPSGVANYIYDKAAGRLVPKQ